MALWRAEGAKLVSFSALIKSGEIADKGRAPEIMGMNQGTACEYLWMLLLVTRVGEGPRVWVITSKDAGQGVGVSGSSWP